ncbi:MAG: phosphotransferase enzyme family protein, partial [Tumebacillaceae bacterium]
EIVALFHEGIVAEAAKRYGVALEDVRFVKDMESYVYEFEQEGKLYILKITHTLRRSPDYLMGEFEWLNYLADQGMTVCRAVPSVEGNLVEQIPTEQGHFLAMTYEKAPGHQVNSVEEWNAELFRKWGRYIGRMHALTKDYQVSNPAYKRQEWDAEDKLNVRKYVPSEQTTVIANVEALIERIRQLPKDRDTYGLIHSDLHQGNFFYHEGTMYAFDFDDLTYYWFMGDIAKVLYFVQWWPAVPYADKSEFAREFMQHFLKGYREENQLDAWWLQHIPDFLRLQHALLYGLFHEFMDLDNLEPEQAEMLAQYRHDLEQETPIVDLDFTAFAEVLVG